MPRNRGTFRKTRSRKRALPSRGLLGTRDRQGAASLVGTLVPQSLPTPVPVP